jgi:dissimilatory sulfite reductase beta subunit
VIFCRPVIKENKGKWLYHEILEPGVLMHVSETGGKVFTVRCAVSPSGDRQLYS